MTKKITNLVLMPLALFIFISQSAFSNELITDSKLKEWIKYCKSQLPGVVVNEDGGIDSTTANLEALAKIEELTCSSSSLVSIDELIRHMTSLKTLVCSNNPLYTLDLTNNIELKTLECYNTQLSTLDVKNNMKLEKLYCWSNQLTNLDVSQNIELTNLICASNQLTTLDLTNNIKLEELNYVFNQISSLDLSKHIKLTSLKCAYNQLTTLDVSNNIELTLLNCSGNQLTILDLTNNIKLEELHCDNTQLSTLDVKNNMKLEKLYCWSNQLARLDITSLPNLGKLQCCNQAEGFILYLTKKQKSKFTEANYCNAILKEKDGSICEIEWLDIYPNPTAGKFFIDSKFLSDEIKILNLAGEVLYRETLNAEKTEIDISNLPAGVYFVITKGKVGKVIKN